MLKLYKTYIRPIIEFASCVWNTGFDQDYSKLEAIQRNWTKSIEGLNNLSYSDRLRILNLYSVKGRLTRIDLVKTWKIFNNMTSVKPDDLFTVNSSSKPDWQVDR